MNLKVTVPDNLEEKLKLRAAAEGLDVEAYVQTIIQSSLTEAETRISDAVTSPPPVGEALLRIRRRHAAGNPAMDDSRESIYSGRGE